MDSEFILKRAERLREEMEKTDTDAFVVLTDESYNWETLYYFSGFRGTSGAMAVYKDSVELILDGRYRQQGERQSPYPVTAQKNSLVDDLIESISAHGAQKFFVKHQKPPIQCGKSYPPLKIPDGATGHILHRNFAVQRTNMKFSQS